MNKFQIITEINMEIFNMENPNGEKPQEHCTMIDDLTTTARQPRLINSLRSDSSARQSQVEFYT